MESQADGRICLLNSCLFFSKELEALNITACFGIWQWGHEFSVVSSSFFLFFLSPNKMFLNLEHC